MRRKEMEVTDLKEIIRIVDKCEIIHLGLVDDKVPYVVPLNFGYEAAGEQLTFFFHSAAEGRKIDILTRNPYVCFEMECSYKITPGEIACKYSAEYESVIGYGDVSFISDEAERKIAMDSVMRKYGYEGNPEYSPKAFSRIALCKLTVSQIVGKRNIK